jgi:uncharacterized damage-inducible protein DinB
MDAEYFRTLFDYTYWARDRILKAADGLSEADYARPNGFTYGSIRGILTHCAQSESGYLARWMGEQVEPITQESAPTIEALASRWREREAAMRAYLVLLKDEDLAREIVSRRRDGSEQRRPLWQDVTQIVNHSTQHRSEAAEALTMVGRSPGDLDVSLYFRERVASGT